MINLLPKVKVEVLRTVDGDTVHCKDVWVDFPDFYVVLKKPKLRFLGVNTPERKQPGYQEAKDFTKEHLEGKEIYAEFTGKDYFGRYLCVIYLEDGTNFNDLLLEKGLAKVYKK